MRIREANPTDAEAIRDVHRRSIEELGREAYDREQVDAWAKGCESADYAAAIESEDLTFVVAERDEAIVGFGSLKLTPADEYEASADAEITGLYVRPSVARRGVGTRLCAELERRARVAGAQTLGLTASLNAVPFYEAREYERVAERSHEFSSHESTGVTGTVVEMRKEL